MVEAKYPCFPIFCIFTIPWSYFNIGFKDISPLNCLIPVKTTCNFYWWIQLLPVFQNVPRHTNIWPDLWVTSVLEWEAEPGSNAEKGTSTQCLCTNISKTIELKQLLKIHKSSSKETISSGLIVQKGTLFPIHNFVYYDWQSFANA